MFPRRFPQRHSEALILESRILLDAAVTATAEAVAAASDSQPGVAATTVEATVTVDDTSTSQTVDLFSDVTVTAAGDDQALTDLVITVDSTGSNQALVIDGDTISLETGAGMTQANGYAYTVQVSDTTTTITISINSSDKYTAEDTANLIDGISYAVLDNTVENGDVTVTLSSLSDNGDTAELGISSTVTIESSVNVAPSLSDNRALEAVESVSLDSLGQNAQVVYSSDGSHAYAAGEDGTISVFSLDDNGRLTLEDTISIEGLSTVADMAIATSDNGTTTLYVVDGSSSNLYVIDASEESSLSLVETASAGGTSRNVAVSDDGLYVYVSNEYNGIIVYSRDAETGALSQIQSIDEGGLGVTRAETIVSANGYVYVTGDSTSFVSYDSLTVLKINDDGTLTVVNTVQVSSTTLSSTEFSMVVSDDATLLYLGNSTDGTLQIYRFDGSTLSLVDTISIEGVTSLAMSSDGSVLYALAGDGTLNIYATSSTGTLTWLGSADVEGGSDIATSGDGLSILVAGVDGVARYTGAQTLNQGDQVTFADGVTLADSNFDALDGGAGNYNGASLTVNASVEGGSFGFEDGGGLTYSDGTIFLDGSAIATLAVNDGVLTGTFTADISTETANQVLQQLTYANDDVEAGSYVGLTLVASDGALTSASLAITLRVNSVPQLNTDASTGYALDVATSETDYRFTLFPGLFSDVDGDSLTWTVEGLPEGLSFDAETLTISGSAQEVGTFSVTVTVTDASGASASLVLDLVVNQIDNRAPEVNGDTSTTLDYAAEGTDYSTTLDTALFTDADSIYGDSLSWTVSGLPDGFTFDAETLTISGSSDAVGDYTVTVTVTDESGASASVALTLRVITVDEADNGAPALDADASALVYTADGSISGANYAVYGMDLSSDDSTLLVVGNSSLNATLTPSGNSTLYVYSRDVETGDLTLVQTFAQGSSDDGDDTNGIEVNGLIGATSVVYSSDGSYAYVVGQNDEGNYAITVFSVNSDGSLTVTELGTALGTEQIKQIVVSDDGNTLYAVSGSGVYSVAIDDDAGLTLVGTYSEVSGTTAVGIEVDSSGVVYVLSSGSAQLTVYTTNDDSSLSYAGKLTRSGTTLTYTDASGNATSVGELTSSSGLSAARAFTVSDDGTIYIVTGANSYLTILQYDGDSNSMVLVSSVNVYSQMGAYPWGVSLSADGSTLYVGSNLAAMAVYSINDDGTVTYVRTVSDTGGRGLRFVVASDGSSIYVGGYVYATGLGQVSVADAVALSYTERSSVLLASDIRLADAEYDALNDGEGNYNGAVITIAREGGANAADSYGFTEEGNGLTLADGVIYLDGSAIASFASEDGTLTITFTAEVSTATANLVLQQITYSNTSSDPGSSITLVLSVADEYTSSAIGIQLSVSQVNDAPTLEASAGSVVYTSGGNAVKLFGDSAVSTVESDQTVSSLTLTVSGLADGESETLVVGGVSVALTSGSSASGSVDVTDAQGNVTTYGYTLSVSVAEDGTATVTLSGSLPADLAQTLIDSIAYANTSELPTEGERTVTLTSIKDSGGTDNEGVDTTTLAIAASVTVSLSNTAPAVTATGATASYTEKGEAAQLFSDVTVSTGEAGQTISSFTLTVGGVSDGDSEILTVDGTAIALVEGTGTTASGYVYTVTVDADSGLVTILVSSASGIEVDAAADLIAAIAYTDSSTDPTAGTRVVTLTAIQDDGGTGNAGVDTTALAIAASVAVTGVNDAPALEANAAQVDYTSSESSAALFSDVSVSTGEAGQRIAEVTFTVSGLLDGSREILTVDGVSIALTAGSGTTDSGYGYTVSIDGDTATVTIVSDGGLSGEDAAALIESASYANLSVTKTAGERIVGVSVRDDGGTENGGQDSTTLTSSARVAVVENSAPVLGSSPDNNDLEVADSISAISGLSDIAASALSSDGAFLYVASSEGGIAIFLRNTQTGELVLQQTLESGVASVTAIAISEDGGTVYVLGEGGDALAVYSRDAGDGSLALLQILDTENVVDFAVSADGDAIYVVDGNYSGLLVYTLNQETGEYALSQSIVASTGSEPYLFSGVSVAVSGDYVYVVTDPAADTVANTLIVYQRSGDGTLAAVAYIRDSDEVDLGQPVAVTVSDDGATVYVANADSVSVFRFDAGSGSLAVAATLDGLSGVTSIALSDDEATLYVVSADGGISRYLVGEDGTLTLLETLSSDDASALAGAQSVMVGALGSVVVSGAGGVVSLTDHLLDEVPVDYTEQSTISPAAALTLGDTDYDALADGAGSYNGAVIAISRADGADASDVYGFADGNGLTLEDGILYLDDEAIATFSSEDGALTVTFTADVSTAVANLVLQQITYTNTGDDPGDAIALTVKVSDAYTSTSATLRLDVVQINDAPVVSGTGASATYTEGEDGAALFSDVSLDTVEAGDTVTAFTLAVSGVADGASESLTIDGTEIALVAGTYTTASGHTVVVSVSDEGVAVAVTLGESGILADEAEALIEAIRYANGSDDPTAGTRSVTLSSVSDSSGTANGGADTTETGITASVAVAAVNDAPILTSTPVAATFTEGGAAAALFSGTAIDTVEAGQLITTLTLSVSGVADGESESLVIDGTRVALAAGSGVTTNGYGYVVSITDGVATITLTLGESGIEAGDAAALVDALAYDNSSEDPTEGERVVTLAGLQDSGGEVSAEPGIGAVVIVAAVNDVPVAAGSGGTSDYAASGDAAALFSGMVFDAGEAGQTILGLTFTVDGVADANEQLVFDGTAIALREGTGTTASGYAYVVTVVDGMATVTLALGESGVAAADAAGLVDAMTYLNASDTVSLGERVVTLASIQDSGGTANGGADTASLAIVATVTVVNSAPNATAEAYSLEAATQGAGYSVTLPETLFEDADGDSLTWSVSGLPEGLSFDPATRTISGTPTVSGVVTLVLTVTDAHGASASRTLSLEVVNIATPLPADYFNPARGFAPAGAALADGGSSALPQGALGSLSDATLAMVNDPFAALGESPTAFPGMGTSDSLNRQLDALFERDREERQRASGREAGRGAATLDIHASALLAEAGSEGADLSARSASVAGTWQRDVAGNRHVFALPAGLFAVRTPVASVTLRGADGGPPPDSVRLDIARGLIVSAGVQDARSVQLVVQVRTVDGRVLSVPVRIGAAGEVRVWSGEAGHAVPEFTGKLALSESLPRQHDLQDLRAQVRDLLDALADDGAESPISLSHSAAPGAASSSISVES